MSTRVIVIIVVAVAFLAIGVAVGNSMAKKKAARLNNGTTAPLAVVTDEKAAA